MGICGRFHKDLVPDGAWADFYVRLMASGREPMSFYTGPCVTVPEFVSWVRKSPNPWWLLTWKGKIAGCLYLTDIQGKSGNVHFTCLPLPEPRAALRICRFGLAHILHCKHHDGVNMMDSLRSLTPVWNEKINRFVPLVGGVVLGVLPLSCYSFDSQTMHDGVISYFTRETVPAEWAAY